MVTKFKQKVMQQMTKQTSKKKNKQNIFLNIIFLIGFLVALYPFYVGALNHFIDQQRIKTIQKETNQDISAKETRMQQKNAQLRKDGIQPGSDPFSGSTYKEHVVLKKHLIGTISISKINVHIPLFDTTNEETLNYGATVLQGPCTIRKPNGSRTRWSKWMTGSSVHDLGMFIASLASTFLCSVFASMMILALLHR